MEKSPTTKKSFSLDWLVRGTLTKVGDMFDRFTGRNWKPAGNLATSELIERLKRLLDTEARNMGEQGKFVPHHIKLLMQWDKFSTDSEDSLKKLEHELLTAAIDHINDRRYHTFAPLKFEIKTDYFTEDVRLQTSFDGFVDEHEGGKMGLDLTAPDLKNVILTQPEAAVIAAEEVKIEPEKEIFTASYNINNIPRVMKLTFAEKQRLSVGRSRENNLWLDDVGVSKIHASLVLSAERQLMVADTGSTNGTFVNGIRIAYGTSAQVNDGEQIKFGTVDVVFRRVPKQTEGQNFAVQNFSTDEEITVLSNSAASGNRYKTNEDFAKNQTPKPFEQKTNVNFSENKTD
jgi:pSer/pThr/pTyr-binding forkhead associated (FHA) protein